MPVVLFAWKRPRHGRLWLWSQSLKDNEDAQLTRPMHVITGQRISPFFLYFVSSLLTYLSSTNESRHMHHSQLFRDRAVATNRQAMPSHDGGCQFALSSVRQFYRYPLRLRCFLRHLRTSILRLSALVCLSLLPVGACCASPSFCATSTRTNI